MQKSLEYQESNWVIWLKATRPRTLPASLCPVLTGVILAMAQGYFQWLPAMVCLLFALLIQIGTNFANEYYDFLKGADNEERKGPRRAVAAGLITPVAMLKATAMVLGAAFVLGCVLLWYGPWWFMGIGVASILFAVLYSAGPYALAYNGLSDFFVILFFGVVAVNCTFYVQTHFFSLEVFLISLVLGLLIDNILIVANYRDADQDRKVGKMTLIARFGKRFGIWQHRMNLMAVYGILIYLGTNIHNIGYLFPFMLLPRGISINRSLAEARELKAHLRLLAQTSSFLLLFTVVLIIGILFGHSFTDILPINQ